MKTLSLCVTLACLAAPLAGGMASADDASVTVADVVELQVLDRLRGQWSGTLDAGTTSLKLTSRWILDGHVLETKFELDGGFRGLMLRTFDAADDEYVTTFMGRIGNRRADDRLLG